MIYLKPTKKCISSLPKNGIDEVKKILRDWVVNGQGIRAGERPVIQLHGE